MTEPVGEPDLIDRLVRHGLAQAEARCYVAMLEPRAFKVSEVALRAGIPRPRAYELLHSLVRLGLCTEVGGDVARFRAVPPGEAIGRIEAFLGEQARRRNAALVSVLHALQERDDRWGGIADPVAMLRRPDQVLACYERAVRAAEREVVNFAAMPWQPVDSIATIERAAGLSMRALHERAVLDSAPHHDCAAFYERNGVDVRVVDHVDVTATVFDRRTVLLNLSVPGTTGEYPPSESLLIRHTGLGETLHQAFERLWERGIPFRQALDEAGLPPPRGPWPDPVTGVPPGAPESRSSIGSAHHSSEVTGGPERAGRAYLDGSLEGRHSRTG